MAKSKLHPPQADDLENSFTTSFDNGSTASIMAGSTGLSSNTGQVHHHHPGQVHGGATADNRSRCKRWTALLCSTVGIIFILLAYVICGAIVFSNLEGASNYKSKAFASGVKQMKCIALECGLQNGTLALFVSTQIFGTDILYALPTGAYALIMYITGFIFIYFLKKSN